MRLIDADALLDKLPKEYIGSTIHLLINDAPTISAEAVQWWIPCSERLPDIGNRCLVTLSNNVVAIGTLHNEDDKRWHLEPASMMIAYHEDSVVAWMPLPI